MKEKSPKAMVEPPLEVIRSTEIDQATGSTIDVAQMRRGILCEEHRTYDPQFLYTWLQRMSSSSPRQSLEAFRDELRDRLEGWGLPSDRQFHWQRGPGGEWEPRPEGKWKRGYEYTTWYQRLKDLTASLSRQRQVGQVLRDLDRVLRRKGVDEYLLDMVQFASSWSTLRISGATNAMATAGIAARKARSLGPATRRAKAAERSSIINEFATKLRAEQPRFKGDASNTAATIANDVNATLALRNLLPATGPLSVKTISDHLRGIVGGKRLRIG